MTPNHTRHPDALGLSRPLRLSGKGRASLPRVGKRERQSALVDGTANVYLDTNIISAVARGQFPEEQQHLSEILQLHDKDGVSLFTSTMAMKELAKIPEKHRARHIAVYELFRAAQHLEPGGITRLGPMGAPSASPAHALWNQIRVVVPDLEDAEHIFTAARNRAHFFLTFDSSTILKYKEELMRVCGVRAVKPSEFREEYKVWRAL